MTYLLQGRGRHADSMGNREMYDSPGFQWCSVGSGIEHAEGGGDPKGSVQHGFQIWINVPKANKNDDPRYGTESPENIPLVEFGGGQVRLLAGRHEEKIGPFKTVQPVQMMDFVFVPGAEHAHPVPPELDNCLVYVYKGGGTIGGKSVSAQHCAQLDAQDRCARSIVFNAGAEGLSALLFAGMRIGEPIVCHEQSAGTSGCFSKISIWGLSSETRSLGLQEEVGVSQVRDARIRCTFPGAGAPTVVVFIAVVKYDTRSRQEAWTLRCVFLATLDQLWSTATERRSRECNCAQPFGHQ